MDYARYLTLFSGGADSTYFIVQEPTARHLLHFSSTNQAQTQHAQITALENGRYLSVVTAPSEPRDGEINQIHALSDSLMALEASIIAARYGMNGIVICFNQDDLGIDIEAIAAIMHRAEPDFEILAPLSTTSAREIRAHLQSHDIPYVSCMRNESCGKCSKCRRETLIMATEDMAIGAAL